jgi:hypothetical protein
MAAPVRRALGFGSESRAPIRERGVVGSWGKAVQTARMWGSQVGGYRAEEVGIWHTAMTHPAQCCFFDAQVGVHVYQLAYGPFDHLISLTPKDHSQSINKRPEHWVAATHTRVVSSSSTDLDMACLKKAVHRWGASAHSQPYLAQSPLTQGDMGGNAPTQDHLRIAARQNLRTLGNQSLLKCIVCAAWGVVWCVTTRGHEDAKGKGGWW